MFIAHLPSGYLLALRLQDTFPETARARLMTAALSGALFPDADLLYFFLVDHQQVHHHRYFTHWPLFWLGIQLLLWLPQGLLKRQACRLARVFCAGALLHVLLDTVSGDIWWLAPWVDRPFALVSVPDRFSPWWLNFILHGSFLIELAICGLALRAYRMHGSGPRLNSPARPHTAARTASSAGSPPAPPSP